MHEFGLLEETLTSQIYQSNKYLCFSPDLADTGKLSLNMKLCELWAHFFTIS